MDHIEGNNINDSQNANIKDAYLDNVISNTKSFSEDYVLDHIYENIFSDLIDRNIFNKYINIGDKYRFLRTVNNSIFKMEHLKIGIDTGAMHHKDYSNRGIGFLIKNYIEILQKIPHIELVPLSKTNCYDRYDVIHFTSPPVINSVWNDDIFNEIKFIRNECLKNNKSKIYVITVYDLIPHIFKDIYKPSEIYYEYISLLRQMDIIIAISNSTKNDLVSNFGIPEENIYVIYPSLKNNFFNISKIKIEHESVLVKYGITKKFILCTAGVEFRKNIERTIKSYILARNNGIDAQLVIVCTITKDQQRLYLDSVDGSLSNNIIFTGYISDYELNILYNSAYASIYIPLYEGFGMPIIESISCRIPIIISKTSSLEELNELSDNNLIIVNPYNIEDIANAIKYIFTIDKSKYDNYVDNAYKMLQLFDSNVTGRELMNLYKYCIIKKIMTKSDPINIFNF